MSTTTTLSTTNGQLTLVMEGNNIISAAIADLEMTESYLEDKKIVLSDGNAPHGVIVPLTAEDINNLLLVGGKVNLFAEDLFAMTVRPEWWTVECDMAIEGDAPEWPMAEDAQANPLADIIDTIMGMLVIGDDDDTMTTQEKYDFLGWDAPEGEEK